MLGDSARPWLLVGLICAAILGAGCTDASDDALAKQASDEAQPTQPDDLTGSVAGLVTSDEALPLKGVRVGVVSPGVETVTDAEGRFTFNGLEPAEHIVTFGRLGYESVATRVVVEAGRVSEMVVEMKPIPIGDISYTSTDTRVSLIHFGARIASVFVTNTVNLSAVNQMLCDACLFTLFFEPAPQQVMTETQWPPTAPVNQMNGDVWIYYKSEWDTASYALDGTMPYYGSQGNRQSVMWSDDGAGLLKEKDRMLLSVNPAYYGSFEHKITVYTSFAYEGDFDDDFTALPPPDA